MKETLDIKTVYQCNCCLGCSTLHPQASVIRLNNANVTQHSIKFDFYSILLIENDVEDCCCCGRKSYDYSNATIVFLPPRQAFDINKDRVLPPQGWLLAFHPDLLSETTLEKTIRKYTFFYYRKEEALHLSQREKDKIVKCLQEIDEELHHPIDYHSRTIISRHIELLLDYCTRYYERQFITRENKSKALLSKMSNLLNEYIYSGKLRSGVPPTPAFYAENLNISVPYLEDLLRFEKGQCLQDFFQLVRLKTAKEMLLNKEKTIAEIACQLGFPNIQQFSFLFKKVIGITPDEYRSSQS